MVASSLYIASVSTGLDDLRLPSHWVTEEIWEAIQKGECLDKT